MNKVWSGNFGGAVYCDLCNCDGWGDDDHPLMGGGIVDGYALCPDCFNKAIKERAGEIIRFDQAKTFGDNVREYRLKETGSPDLIIEIWTLGKKE